MNSSSLIFEEKKDRTDILLFLIKITVLYVFFLYYFVNSRYGDCTCSFLSLFSL